MSDFVPTWAEGFAVGDASMAPGLWKGVSGWWTAPLGPTGLTLRDQWALQNHGVLTNMSPAADWVVTEKGWALDFTDSTNVVTAPTDVIDTGDISVVALVLARGMGGGNNGRILDNRDGGSFALGMSSSNNKLFGRRGDLFPVSADNSIPFNVWRHVVITSDASAETWNYYIEGVLSGAANQATGTISDTGNATHIGNHEDFDRGWDGQIAFVGIYNRVLTLGEIQELYERPNAMFTPRPRQVAVELTAPPAFGGVNQIIGGGIIVA